MENGRCGFAAWPLYLLATTIGLAIGVHVMPFLAAAQSATSSSIMASLEI